MDNDIRGRMRGYQSGRPQRRPTPIGRTSSASPRPKSSTSVRPPTPNHNSQQSQQQASDPMSEITNIYRQQNERQVANTQAVSKSSKKKSKRKTGSGKGKVFFIVLLILLLLGGIGYGGYWYTTRDSSNSNSNPFALGSGQKAPPQQNVVSATQQAQAVPDPQPTVETIRFVATGDMIAHDSVNENAKKPDGSFDYVALMSGMKQYFDKSDVNFCVQSTPAGGEQFGITGYPIFNAPIAWSRGIESVGCNVINIGTNHTNDKGQELINEAVAGWDKRGVLAVTGANRTVEEQNSVEYFEVQGIKFAVMNYMTYNNNPATDFGVNMYSAAFAKQQVEAAKKEADVVIVSMRWGTEYSQDVNAEQDAIAQELANFGADVVLGHGPHVLQPVKKMQGSGGNETLVWYSLGNFLNTQLEAETLVGGFAIMDIDVASKTIADPQFMPVYMHYDWTAQEAAAQNLLARRNLQMVPLDQADDLLAKSQLGTNVKAQTDRVTALLNKFTPVQIINSSEF